MSIQPGDTVEEPKTGVLGKVIKVAGRRVTVRFPDGLQTLHMHNLVVVPSREEIQVEASRIRVRNGHGVKDGE